MELFAWLVFGALSGYLAGLAIFDEEGLGVFGHVILGAIGGIVGGLGTAMLLGVHDPLNTLNPTTLVSAIVTAAFVVVVVNGYAEQRHLGGV